MKTYAGNKVIQEIVFSGHSSIRLTVGALTVLLMVLLVPWAAPSQGSEHGADTSTDTRSASAPELDTTVSWTYSYTVEDPPGTSIEGTETLSVEDVRKINMGGFQYDAYRISVGGSETFDTGEHTGTTTFTGTLFLRTADLALIKADRSTESRVDGVPSVRKTEVVETYQPPRMDYKFPLEKSKSWNASTHLVRQVTETIDDDPPNTDVTEEDLSWRYGVLKVENVTVNAGKLECYAVRRSDEANMQNYTQYWYSPEAGWFAKQETWKPGGTQPEKTGDRELDSWERNLPPAVIRPETSITMEEDGSDDSLDLNDVFEDPNGDDLVYTFDETAWIHVSLSGGRVTLAPAVEWSGTETIIFQASDGISDMNASASVNVTVSPVDDPPVLSGGTVSPGVGTEETVFTYSLTCIDVEGDAPDSAKVVIDGTSHELEIPGLADWTHGVPLRFSTALPLGKHSYGFSVTSNSTSVAFPATGELNGPTVSLDDLPPVLSGPGVTPEEGDTNDYYNFTVTYTDTEGIGAEYCRMYLDGEPMDMYTESGDAANGTGYELTLQLLAGSHYFYFICSDGVHEVRLPEEGSYRKPDVREWKNTPPELSEGRVTPSGGDDTALYRFSVKCSDADGQEPTWGRIKIDGKDRDMKEGDGTMLRGREYYYETFLEAGEHTYQFKFYDGYDTVEYPETEELLLVVEESDSTERTDTSGPGSQLTTYLAVAVAVIFVIILLLVLIRSGKRKQGESHEVRPVEVVEEESEWE